MAEVAAQAPKKMKKIRVQAQVMIWNGFNRIRAGTVFDMEHEEGKPLPRSVEIVEEKQAEVVSLGKRERTGPTNLVKDQTGPGVSSLPKK